MFKRVFSGFGRRQVTGALELALVAAFLLVIALDARTRKMARVSRDDTTAMHVVSPAAPIPTSAVPPSQSIKRFSSVDPLAPDAAHEPADPISSIQPFTTTASIVPDVPAKPAESGVPAQTSLPAVPFADGAPIVSTALIKPAASILNVRPAAPISPLAALAPMLTDRPAPSVKPDMLIQSASLAAPFAGSAPIVSTAPIKPATSDVSVQPDPSASPPAALAPMLTNAPAQSIQPEVLIQPAAPAAPVKTAAPIVSDAPAKSAASDVRAQSATPDAPFKSVAPIISSAFTKSAPTTNQTVKVAALPGKIEPHSPAIEEARLPDKSQEHQDFTEAFLSASRMLERRLSPEERAANIDPDYADAMQRIEGIYDPTRVGPFGVALRMMVRPGTMSMDSVFGDRWTRVFPDPNVHYHARYLADTWLHPKPPKCEDFWRFRTDYSPVALEKLSPRDCARIRAGAASDIAITAESSVVAAPLSVPVFAAPYPGGRMSHTEMLAALKARVEAARDQLWYGRARGLAPVTPH